MPSHFEFTVSPQRRVISSGNLEILIRKLAVPDERNKGEAKPAWGRISKVLLAALCCTKFASLKTTTRGSLRSQRNWQSSAVALQCIVEKENTQFVIYNLSRADARPSTFWLQKCNMDKSQGH
jgi:hypothetical protein